MSPTTTAIPEAITYLVATARTQWAGDQTAFVFDGPTPAGFNTEAQNQIWIGADPSVVDEPGREAAVSQRQDTPTLSQGRTQDEWFDVVCAVQSWDGGTDLSVARAAAFGYYRTFELFLRGTAASAGPGDVTMGGGLGTVGWAGITQKALHQQQQSKGCVALITFYVSCRARLTS